MSNHEQIFKDLETQLIDSCARSAGPEMLKFLVYLRDNSKIRFSKSELETLESLISKATGEGES